MLCNSRRAPAALLAILAALGGLTGCKRRAPEPSGDPAAQPSASASALPLAVVPRCAEPAAAGRFTIGERTPAKSAEADPEDDDAKSDDPGLPFAVELGTAVPTGQGFAVGGLSTKAGVTSAVVAVVDASASHGKLIELGKLHGDPDPPELAADEDALIALVRDADAGGEHLRLVALRSGPVKMDVVLGAEIAESRDHSRVARVALGKERGVAIWDAWPKPEKRGTIRTATFSKKDVSNVTRPRKLSLGGDDAEGPEIVRRPGGFWAAWISRPRPDSAALRADAGLDPSVLDAGIGTIQLVALDENGVPTGEPKPVTATEARVLGFDLRAARDGSALLAWKDDAAAPGTDQRRVFVAQVRLDGSIERQVIEDEQGNVGIPILLVDGSPPERATAGAWLVLGSVSDETRLAALDANGRLLDGLAPEPLVRSAEPLALARGRFLLARPAGLAMELSVAECNPGPRPPAP